MKACKDCSSTTRQLKYPGPRCATCWRTERQRRRRVTRDRYYQKTYGISLVEYEALKAWQGGVCYICRRATGATKELSTDHDHATGEVRGLLCSPDNQMIGQARDDPAFFQRAIDYLSDPPYARYRRETDSSEGAEQ